MSDNKSKIPSAFGYALFAGTSTLLAFLLPVVIWIIFFNASTLPIWLQLTLIYIFLATCLYHGYYRAITLVADLGAAGKKLILWQRFFRYTLFIGLFLLFGAIISTSI